MLFKTARRLIRELNIRVRSANGEKYGIALAFYSAHGMFLYGAKARGARARINLGTESDVGTAFRAD